MTTYAVFAVHAFSNSELKLPEAARCGSKEVAESIVDALKKERFTSGGKRLKRYSAVFMREVEE